MNSNDLDTRIEPTVDAFKREFLSYLRYGRGVDLPLREPLDGYFALSRTVRRHLMQRWLESQHAVFAPTTKTVCYLSAEYLLGRQLENNLLCTGLTDVARQAMRELDLDLDALRELELEPGLGNGGLGRLAACFLDSLTTLNMPAIGYGIRYEFGIFRQTFVDGAQVEQPDDWSVAGNPWELTQPEMAIELGFGGRTEAYTDAHGLQRVRWLPAQRVLGVPYNFLIPGYGVERVNTLRLWRARATRTFDLHIFNTGDYTRAVEDKMVSENISKVLYPEDSTPQGKALRLQQQYFFAACSLGDILRAFGAGFDATEMPERVALQLNDTHPTIAIAELMRLLVDERSVEWNEAWEITRNTFSYTCHTLLPEALEVWPVELIDRLLPRHMQIIREIDRRLQLQVRAKFGGDDARRQRMAIIGDGGEPQVRMAHLATVGSYRVNGVAEIHSRLLKETVLTDFAALWPERFTNVTNGVTPRRFMRIANPLLSELITSRIGGGWLSDLDALREIESHADDSEFRSAWASVKAANKTRLARHLHERSNVQVDAGALHDVMIKRLHEYKRQVLKLLHVLTLYERAKSDPGYDFVPRVVIFGAKAAPGYRMAKLIIRLINAVATVVNTDRDLDGRLKIVFPANYNVTLAEHIIPAADLSEQISLAGKEASGTGNMKLSLNGALTIGTLDGANIEIRERVGAESFFLFGMTEPEVAAARRDGYDPRKHYVDDAMLRACIDRVASGMFSPEQFDLFTPIVESLLTDDPYMVMADYASYIRCQDEVDAAYRDPERWTRMSILNTARSGFFSSDRAIREYRERIWKPARTRA